MSVAISNNSKQDQTCYDVLMGMTSKAVMAEWSVRDRLFHFLAIWVAGSIPGQYFCFSLNFLSRSSYRNLKINLIHQYLFLQRPNVHIMQQHSKDHVQNQ